MTSNILKNTSNVLKVLKIAHSSRVLTKVFSSKAIILGFKARENLLS